MLLKELLSFRDKLPKNAKGIIDSNCVLLVMEEVGLKTVGTISNHNKIYDNYKIVEFDSSCEHFIYICEV